MIGAWVGMAFGAIVGVVGVLVTAWERRYTDRMTRRPPRADAPTARNALGISSKWMPVIIAWSGVTVGVRSACGWAILASFLGALFGSADQDAVFPVLGGPIVAIAITFGLLGIASSALDRLCRMTNRWSMNGRFSKEITDIQPLQTDLATHYNTPVGVVLMNDHVLAITFSDSPFHDDANARDVAAYANCHYASAYKLAAIKVSFVSRTSFIFPVNDLPGPAVPSLVGGALAEPDAPANQPRA
jgi:hypothetical protein